MSLTLLYRGKNVRFSMKLNKFYWLSALVIFAVISGLMIHLFLSANDIPKNPSYIAEQVVDNQAVNVKNQQVTALTAKIAELQSQVLRLNALGDRLADDANIPKEEFNFERLPASGGPTLSQKNNQYVSVEMLKTKVAKLEESLLYEERQLTTLESIALGHYIENAGYLSGKPIKSGWLSSYFGLRKDPFNGLPALHKGLDFAGKEGTEIIATASGIVTWAGERYGYGQLIEINHGNDLKTRYGHNKTIMVKVGDVVSKGQVIARMGNTGRSTGPHVHYEILHKNKQINPLKYVYRKAQK